MVPAFHVADQLQRALKPHRGMAIDLAGKEEAEQLGRNSFHYPTIRAQFAIQLQPERVGQAAAEYPRLVSRP